MKGLLQFLIRYHVVLVYVVLLGIGIVLLSTYNDYHQARIYGVRHAIVGSISEKYFRFSKYLSLHDQNKKLVQENAHLYNQLRNSYIQGPLVSELDTAADERYLYFPALVINNSTNKQHNIITLNVGRKHGVEPDMGVVGPQGIVGVVRKVSEHYSTVVSVLNRDFFPNARIASSEFFGYVEWPGKDYRHVSLKDIPIHASYHKGDSVVTSGFSESFPAGIPIGSIVDAKVENGIQYNFRVKLFTDFKKVNQVMVVKNLHRQELEELQEESNNND